MTEIRMLMQMSGPRPDGQPWPAPHFQGGGTIEVATGEARDLARAGIAEIVPKPKAEKRSKGEDEPPPDEPAGKQERAVVTEKAETRAPAGLTTENVPAVRPRAVRARP